MNYSTELKKLFAPIKYKGRYIHPNINDNGYIFAGLIFPNPREARFAIDILTHFQPLCNSCGKLLENSNEKFCEICGAEDGK